MKVIICNDEWKKLAQWSNLIQSLDFSENVDLQIVPCKGGNALLETFQRDAKRADIIVMDVCLSGYDGIELAAQLRALGCRSEIIFLTNHKDRMLDAFDVAAFHYIIEDETPQEKVERIFNRALAKVKEREREYMTFSYLGDSIRVPIDSIQYFEILQRIITVHYLGDKQFKFYARLGQLEEVLNEKKFVRIHRAYLVSLRYIQSISFKEVKMKDGGRLPVGRNYYPQLKERFSSSKKKE